mgnify:CR=1 FL=1
MTYLTTTQKGTTLVSEMKKIVYSPSPHTGVLGPAKSKSGHIFELSILLSCHFDSFCQNSLYNFKTRYQTAGQMFNFRSNIYQFSQAPDQFYFIII